MTVVGAFDTVELVDYMDTHGTSKKGYLPFVGPISCGVAILNPSSSGIQCTSEIPSNQFT